MTPESDPNIEGRLRQLRGLVEANPHDPLARFLLGCELSESGQFEDARESFAAAIRLQPEYSAAYRQLGNCLEKLEQFPEAATIYSQGAEVAEKMGDLQAGKEMRAFLRRLERDHKTGPE